MLATMLKKNFRLACAKTNFYSWSSNRMNGVIEKYLVASSMAAKK